MKEYYRISCKLHPCKETPRIIKYGETKTSCHRRTGEKVSNECNMNQIVLEEKIPVVFEPELFENESLILIPSICLTHRESKIISKFQYSIGVTMT